MKPPRDRFLDSYIHLLERSLDRERKRVDFLEGKCERLELVVMEARSDAGRQYAERTDRAEESTRRKPPIMRVPVNQPARMPFSQVRESWNNLSEQEQQKAIESGNLEVKPKENTA